MTAFARPGVVAAILMAAALILHPAVRSDQWLPARDAALAVSDATVTVGGTAITVVGETGFAFDPAS